MIYGIVRAALGSALHAFFRQIEVVGLENVPPEGATLFAGNHPNSIVDPSLIVTTCGRTVHFAAKDTLFDNPLARPLLRALGAVPVARPSDHDGKVDNEAAFEAMYEVLGAGGAVGIFPEGVSRDEARLARLKTGAARLALGAAARAPAAPVSVVPCGLVFVHPERFRSRVLVQYGAPLAVDAGWRARHEADPVEAARALTAELDAALRALTVDAPDWETLRALDTVRRLYRPAAASLEERVELTRRFGEHYPRLRDDARVAALMADVGDYRRRLDAIGVSDHELARDLPSRATAARVARHLAVALVWAPLALLGAPLHAPTLLLAALAGARLAPRKELVASAKLLTGLAFVLVAYAAAVVALWAWASWRAALVAAAALPASGVATLRLIDRLRLVRRGLGVLARRHGMRRELERLRARREELAAAIARVVGAVAAPEPGSPALPGAARGGGGGGAPPGRPA